MSVKTANIIRADLIGMVGKDMYDISFDQLFCNGFPEDPEKEHDSYMEAAFRRSGEGAYMRIWILETIYNIENALRGHDVQSE